MANPSNIETLLGGVADPPLQNVLKNVFRYLLPNLRFGRATGSTQSAASKSTKAENLGGSYLSAMTPAVANTEFTLPHNYGAPPYLLIPVMPLDQVNAAIVRLTVSRAADASNVYLKSPDVGQTFYVYLEG